jgi:type I restriction enzyme, S subunit
MSKIRQIPKLRFPEFGEEWKEIRLKDISQYFNGGSFENNVQEEGKYELVTLKSIDTLGNLVSSKRYIDDEVKTLAKDTLVMILSEQAPGLLGMTAIIPKSNKYVLNQRIAEIRPNQIIDSYFLSMAINRNQRYFSKMGAGMKVQNISKPNVENYKFLYTQYQEQQKIASFLSSVDKKITQLQQKQSLLEQYKKGLMQQLFSQQLRFKDDNGNAYPDWKEKRLGEISIKKSSSISAGQVENNDGIYKIYGASGYFKRVDFYTEVKEYIAIIKDGSGVGRVQLCDAHSSVIGTLDIIYPKSNNNLYFIKCLLENIRFEKYIVGGAIPHIYFKDYSKEKIKNPCTDEQTKIADFLSAIDDKIQLVNTQIEKTQQFKKGLLQQMFV